MDDKDFKPVYIRGTETGAGVIEALEALGGINNCNYDGKCNDYIYFIMPSNFICTTCVGSAYGAYVMATAKEIKAYRWRAKRTDAYYTLDSTLDVIESTEYGDRYDDGRYDSGNYYRTRKEAEEAAEKIKKVLLPN